MSAHNIWFQVEIRIISGVMPYIWHIGTINRLLSLQIKLFNEQITLTANKVIQ